MYSRRGYGRAPGLGIILLGAQLMQVGFNRIPPVTLSAILGQTFLFLNPLKMRFPRISNVCISAINVWYHEDWKRLLLAPFFHVDEWHLYYNMASFLWKGRDLEKRYGSTYFAYMLAVFAALTSSLTVGLAVLAENILGDPGYLSQCAAGFSGVIFALKVVTTYLLPPGVTMIMGLIPVHSRLACWAELLVIHVLVPRSSFIGHLSGILVGLMYVKGPLKLLMDQLHAPAPSYTYYHGRASSERTTSRATYNYSGTTGTRTSRRFTDREQRHEYYMSEYDDNNSNANVDGSAAAGAMSEEEQIRRATEASLLTAQRERQIPTSTMFDNDAMDASEQSPPPAYGSVTPPYPPSESPSTPPYPTGQANGFPMPPHLRTSQFQDAPPYSSDTTSHDRLYPDLASSQIHDDVSPDVADLRQRRLARFDK